MAAVLISQAEKCEVWQTALLNEYPELDLRIRPQVGEIEDIEYAIVARPEPGVLRQFPNLKAIFSLWAGIETLLTDPTLPDGIPIYRMVEPSLTQGMVEYVTCHVLNCHLRTHEYKSGKWEHSQHTQPILAAQRNVGILGLGVLGSACATALSSLGFRVAGWSRTQKEAGGIDSFNGNRQLDAFLNRSQILVCLLPLTPQTDSMLNKETLAKLPQGSWLINAGRGEHLVDGDLLEALENGQLAGAVLDVFRDEPLAQGHPFWSHPKITVTPHVASVTVPATAAPVIVRNIKKLIRGEEIANKVDRKKGY